MNEIAIFGAGVIMVLLVGFGVILATVYTVPKSEVKGYDLESELGKYFTDEKKPGGKST